MGTDFPEQEVRAVCEDVIVSAFCLRPFAIAPAITLARFARPVPPRPLFAIGQIERGFLVAHGVGFASHGQASEPAAGDAVVIDHPTAHPGAIGDLLKPDPAISFDARLGGPVGCQIARAYRDIELCVPA